MICLFSPLTLSNHSFTFPSSHFGGKLKKIHIFTLLLVLLATLLYITIKKSESTLSDSQFIELYVQLSILSEQYSADPQTFKQEKQKLLRQFKTTEKELKKFLKKYQQNPEKLVKIWQKINQKLEGKLKETQKPKP